MMNRPAPAPRRRAPSQPRRPLRRLQGRQELRRRAARRARIPPQARKDPGVSTRAGIARRSAFLIPKTGRQGDRRGACGMQAARNEPSDSANRPRSQHSSPSGPRPLVPGSRAEANRAARVPDPASVRAVFLRTEAPPTHQTRADNRASQAQIPSYRKPGRGASSNTVRYQCGFWELRIPRRFS
jgi:hypothetical protein